MDRYRPIWLPGTIYRLSNSKSCPNWCTRGNGTDTAALTGSSLSSQKRRYDSQGIVDDYAHDDAVRVLLELIAKIAAMHDRVIKPIMSLFDGHHVRVSVLVKTSKEEGFQISKKTLATD